MTINSRFLTRVLALACLAGSSIVVAPATASAAVPTTAASQSTASAANCLGTGLTFNYTPVSQTVARGGTVAWAFTIGNCFATTEGVQFQYDAANVVPDSSGICSTVVGVPHYCEAISMAPLDATLPSNVWVSGNPDDQAWNMELAPGQSYTVNVSSQIASSAETGTFDDYALLSWEANGTGCDGANCSGKQFTLPLTITSPTQATPRATRPANHHSHKTHRSDHKAHRRGRRARPARQRHDTDC